MRRLDGSVCTKQLGKVGKLLFGCVVPESHEALGVRAVKGVFRFLGKVHLAAEADGIGGISGWEAEAETIGGDAVWVGKVWHVLVGDGDLPCVAPGGAVGDDKSVLLWRKGSAEAAGFDCLDEGSEDMLEVWHGLGMAAIVAEGF